MFLILVIEWARAKNSLSCCDMFCIALLLLLYFVFLNVTVTVTVLLTLWFVDASVVLLRLPRACSSAKLSVVLIP